MKKPDTKILLLAGLITIVAVNLLLAYQLYHRQQGSTAASSPASAETGADDAVPVVEGLRTLLDKNPPRRNSYQLVESSNLFSPSRTAWQPPAPEPEAALEETFTEARRTDVVLYGTFVSQGRRGALLEFSTLDKDQRRQRLYPGETVSSGDGRRKKSYTLVDVQPKVVTVKDHNAIVFKIDLYDNKKGGRSSAPSAKSSITVDTASAAASSSAVVAGQSRAEAAGDLVRQRQTTARQQQMLESGELRRVQTPFGTALVKNPQARQPAPNAQ